MVWIVVKTDTHWEQTETCRSIFVSMGTPKSDSESSYAYEKLPNASQLEFSSFSFYRPTRSKTIAYVLLCVFTLGAFYLAARWFIRTKVWARYVACAPGDAKVVVITLKSGVLIETFTRSAQVSPQALGLPVGPMLSLLLCDIQHKTYFLNSDTDQFEPLVFSTSLSYQALHALFSSGLENPQTLTERQSLYGKAAMDVPIPSAFEVFSQEVLHPFFLFQVFSIILWCIELYWIYAIVIFLMSLASVVLEVVTTRENLRKIRQMAYYETQVEVLSGPNHSESTVPSASLVPGQLVSIPQDWLFPCDLLLLAGNCVVNEGLLTGESMPILKDPLPRESARPFSVEEDEKHVLFAGTRCIQVRGKAFGVVIATGFATSKGEIVRSILFPKESRLDFTQDSMRFVGILACIAFVAFVVSIPILLHYGESALLIIILALDLVTISIPPALPLAMTIGTAFAMKRLEKEGIVCIAPSAINAAGSVSVVCCDKTGTLTEDSMKFYGVLPGNGSEFETFGKEKEEIKGKIGETLRICQSLTYINGELLGDPQEVSLAKALSLNFSESGSQRVVTFASAQFSLIHTYYFSSALKRMGVVAQHQGQHTLYMKGAPEVIKRLCKAVPRDYAEVVHMHARQGLRLLACGHRELSEFSPRLSLEQVEVGLEFDGLVMFHNELMQETPETVDCLREAGYQVVIATGDNMLTGLAVAYDSGLTPTLQETYIGEYDRKQGEIHWEQHSNADSHSVHESDWLRRVQSGDRDFALATTGRTLSVIADKEDHEDVISPLLSQLRVCGRMSPDQKHLLVSLYQQQGHIVAMCGDGANDCGALKGADVGLSVSYEEASIAAPFTGQSLSSLITLFREGKAALATSFQVFKFIALYAMIQLISAFILYCLNSDLTSNMFLYIDVVLVVPLIYAMSGIAAYPDLTKDQLPRKLLSLPILVSFVGQMTIQASFLLLAYLLELTQDWYSHDGDSISDPSGGYDNTVLFLVSIFQYVSTCAAFSIGPPFRQPAYRNALFAGTIGVLLLLNLYLLMIPAEWLRDLIDVSSTQLKRIPVEFRFVLLALIVANTASTVLFDSFAVLYLSVKWPALVSS